MGTREQRERMGWAEPLAQVVRGTEIGRASCRERV